jgi:hypothetical protein
MKWVPPRSSAERSEWAKVHPWIAGFYFGLLLSIFMPLVLVTRGVHRFEIIFFSISGLVSWPFFALAMKVGSKRGWGERPNAEGQPAPTWRRPWTRASDRFVVGGLLLGIASGVAWVPRLFHGGWRELVAAPSFGCALWLALTSWAERKRRRAQS